MNEPKVEMQMKAEEIAAEIIAEKVKDIDGLLKVQRECATDGYMIGLYNGMALCKSILTGEPPQYLCQDVETGEVLMGEVNNELKEANKDENSEQ